MAAKKEPYPWTMQQGELSKSYEAFRIYLNMGPTRTQRRVAEELGRTETLIEGWASKHRWTERVRAYESYMMEAATDGAHDWITNSRTETQQLADKLRRLLSSRLDTNIERKEDPTVRWSNAAGVLIKMQDALIAPLDDAKREADMKRIETLLERIQEEATE